MRDTDWKILYELYRFRNITKATASLYMTQPALTKRLRMIEEELEVQIVRRGKYGVLFTSAGEYLAECAAQQVRFMDEVRYKLDYLKNEQKGTLIIGTSYSFNRFQLPPLLTKYRRLVPAVELELVCVKSEKLAQMTEAGQVHVSFVRGNHECEAEQVRISDEQGYILSRDSIDIRQLPDIGRINYDIGNSTQRRIDEWWEQQFDRPPQVSMTTTFIDNAWQMVRQGLGYAICFLAPEQANTLELQKYAMVDKDGNLIKRTTYFLYREPKKQPDYVNKFIQMILDDLPDLH